MDPPLEQHLRARKQLPAIGQESLSARDQPPGRIVSVHALELELRLRIECPPKPRQRTALVQLGE